MFKVPAREGHGPEFHYGLALGRLREYLHHLCKLIFREVDVQVNELVELVPFIYDWNSQMERYLHSFRDMLRSEPDARILILRLERDLALRKPEDRIVQFEAGFRVALEMIPTVPSLLGRL